MIGVLDGARAADVRCGEGEVPGVEKDGRRRVVDGAKVGFGRPDAMRSSWIGRNYHAETTWNWSSYCTTASGM